MAEGRKCPHCLSAIKETTFICSHCNQIVDKSVPKSAINHAHKISSRMVDKAVPRSPISAEQKKMMAGFGIIGGILLLLLIVILNTGSPTPQKPQPSHSSSESKTAVLAQVDALVKTGTMENTTAAMVLIHDKFSTDQIRDDPDVKAKLEQVIAADKKASQPQAEEVFAERVDTYWLPKLKSREVQHPVGTTELWAAESLFEETAREVKNASAFASDKGKSARKRLIDGLREGQIRAFPNIRAAYVKTLREVLWSFDVEVFAQGGANKSILFRGYRYATNANIAETQQQDEINLLKLRFSKSLYQWAKYADQSYYNLKVPADGSVGYWEGNQFVEVK